MSSPTALEIGPSPFRNADSNPLELYEQAASLAPMGAFECDLSSERLSWTSGVFDMFGLPVDHPVERGEAVELYSEASRLLLNGKRSRAIDTRSGFSLDANILRPDGTERWIRITAAVRSSNGYASVLYGMKQDITEDHARWELLRAQAECDPLTGVANRARFQRFLEPSGDEPLLETVGALILFDLDGFKQINDQWGHAAGDQCLVEFGERLRKAFPQATLISRIGGDEFAVLLPPARSRTRMQTAVRLLINTVLGPVRWNGDRLPLSASVGLAFAWEGPDLDPAGLFNMADRALYESKKNTSAFLKVS